MQERKIRMRLQPQDKLLKPNERSCVRWTFRALKLDIQITGVSEKNGSVFTLMQNLWKSKNYCGKTNALIFNMKVQNVKKKKVGMILLGFFKQWGKGNPLTLNVETTALWCTVFPDFWAYNCGIKIEARFVH